MDIQKNLDLVGRFFKALKLGIAKNKDLCAAATLNIFSGAYNVLVGNPVIIPALNFGVSAVLGAKIIYKGYKILRQRENFWVRAFNPSADLPAAASVLPLPSGARGQRLNREP